MSKVILLEKDIDGIYKAKTDRKTLKNNKIRSSKRVIDDYVLSDELVHKIIAENGEKVTDFLNGIEKTAKAFNILIKIMKVK